MHAAVAPQDHTLCPSGHALAARDPGTLTLRFPLRSEAVKNETLKITSYSRIFINRRERLI